MLIFGPIANLIVCLMQVSLQHDFIKQEASFLSEINCDKQAFDPSGSGLGFPNNFAAISGGNHVPHLSDIEVTGGYSSPAMASIPSETGITIRQRPISNKTRVHHSVAHGTAYRRIRLEETFQVGRVESILPNEHKVIHTRKTIEV